MTAPLSAPFPPPSSQARPVRGAEPPFDDAISKNRQSRADERIHRDQKGTGKYDHPTRRIARARIVGKSEFEHKGDAFDEDGAEKRQPENEHRKRDQR